MTKGLTNPLTQEEIEQYIKFLCGVPYAEEDGVKNFLPVRIAKQLLATMQENERMRGLLKEIQPNACYHGKARIRERIDEMLSGEPTHD